MKKTTSYDIATRPKNPLGPVCICACGRFNDSGVCSECPDCRRAVRGISGSTGTGPYDLQPMYDMEREALRDFLTVVEGGMTAGDIPAMRDAIRAGVGL